MPFLLLSGGTSPKAGASTKSISTSASSHCLENPTLVPPPLELIIAAPQLLPLFPGLLTRQHEVHPLIIMQLAGWLVSGYHTQQQAFRNKLKTYSWLPGERALPTLIPQHGENGPADVSHGKSVQFVQMWPPFWSF